MKFGTVALDKGAVAAACLSDGPLFRIDVLLNAPASVARLGRDVVDGWNRTPTLAAFIALGDDAVGVVREALEAGANTTEGRIDAPRLLAPIPRPAKNVFCVGRNYADHIAEDNTARDLATEKPKYPQFFTKPPTAVVGPDAPVIHESVTRRLDYEVELAVVIGKVGKNIPVEAAASHVFGYTICNDITARDLQRRHDQWFKGKALDTTCPLGPMIVHASAIADPRNLGIGLSVNGERRQQANTSDMIFTIEELIASLSAGLTLEPGDIIATGTPSGVGYAMNPPHYLQPGDVVTCRIDGIGTLENRIVAA